MEIGIVIGFWFCIVFLFVKKVLEFIREHMAETKHLITWADKHDIKRRPLESNKNFRRRIISHLIDFDFNRKRLKC